jgi:CheY-like chemotaxis protein
VNGNNGDRRIRVLIADDDEHILKCYRQAFEGPDDANSLKTLTQLDAELFEPDDKLDNEPVFDVVSCNQGLDAIDAARIAIGEGLPFDIAILDVRMPPGIDGVEAGRRIRELDADVEIVFVTGFSDVPTKEMARRVPPRMKLHCFSKPISFIRLAQDVAGLVSARVTGAIK